MKTLFKYITMMALPVLVLASCQSNDDDESSHMAGLSVGAGLNLERFKINIAYGKYHVSSGSLLINLAYSL